MKIAILTSPDQWFVSYAKILNEKIDSSDLYFSHKDINENYDIVFILSYHKIIDKKYLNKHKHNIVIHASALPQGKGWAPMFWQIIEGKDEIPFTMFEAGYGVDDGDIYMQEKLYLTGYELNDELREKQANFIIGMCLKFLDNYDSYKIPRPQTGVESFYLKRGPKDSELDINKTIKEQFDLLRTVDNENYPAFFELDGKRYVIKIELSKMGGGVTLVDFVDLNRKEKKMVLSWRNHEDIKKWMYTKKDIQIDEHLQFINSLVGTLDKQYMLVKKEGRGVGVIDFFKIDVEKKKCEFGIYANPFEKIAGVGKILEEVSLIYAFNFLKLKKLKLEVFEDNIKVRNLHNKYDFKESGEKYVNEKKVICMELNKNG